VLYIPLIPIGAYRVVDQDGGYLVLAREQLSRFAKLARLAVVAVAVLAIGGFAVNSYLNDPDRLARKRWDAALAVASEKDAEAGLAALDAELAGGDIASVPTDSAEHAGAEVVRLAASYVAKPFTPDKLDQAGRVVRRYLALPDRAKGGAARAAMLGALDGWLAQLGDKVERADARLALLSHEVAVADDARAAEIRKTIAATRLAVAKAQAADWPLDALAILAEAPYDAATLAIADAIVARIADAPSLLLDAGPDLTPWLDATKDEALRKKVLDGRHTADEIKDEATADGVTAAQLAAMQTKRPWDQRVTLALARLDADAGKLDAAAARLGKLGAQGMMIRDARFMLGSLQVAQGKLDEADATLTALLARRMQKFAAASAALREAVARADERVKGQLDRGTVPPDFRAKYEAAPEAERGKVVEAWYNEQIDSDPTVVSRREAYLALGDVVPLSLAAGSAKLRRAQKLAGGARDALLADAERTFLAIRAEAEGQPEFRLGLGEIYARLGKIKESDAELQAILDKKEPELSIKVANVYRDIGSVARAKQIAKDVFESSTGAIKDHAAVLLGLITAGDDEESESWFRKADQNNPFVQTTLLELEGQKLYRQGKLAACASKYAAAAKAHLAMAKGTNVAGYNNAALAHQHRYQCSGDPAALTDAQTTLEKAYRAAPDEPLIVGNLTRLLGTIADLHVLAKHIDVRALDVGATEAEIVMSALLAGPQRDAVLAEVLADPSHRRSVELAAQFEVLAPNNVAAYSEAFGHAYAKRDEAAAAAIVERARAAKALDTSEAQRRREKWLTGAEDAKLFEHYGARVPLLEKALAQPKLSAATRAAGNLLLSSSLVATAVYKRDPALLARAREAAVQAMAQWPAIDANAMIVHALVDEAGLAANADAWVKERRTRSAIAAVAHLVAQKSPVGDQIRATKPWGEVAKFARADTTRPGLDEVRLARLLGDDVLATRAKTVLDDKLTRLNVELRHILDPGDVEDTENQELLDKR
jgi:cellulose synthase operon protein C